MPVAATIRDSLRSLHTPPPVELSDRAQTALAQAVALALAPASARESVSDQALTTFLLPSRKAADPAMLATESARVRAIAARGIGWPMATAVLVTPDPADRVRKVGDWGGRRPPASLPSSAGAMEPAAPPAPPYSPVGAGALAGMAAAGSLMRRSVGRPDDPRALDRLAATIEAVNDLADDSAIPNPEAGEALARWAGLVRQVRFVRLRLGIDPFDGDQLRVLREALDSRARWLAERRLWPEREAAASNLLRWSPLVDCGEAWERPLRGRGALRELGQAIRRSAATELPELRQPARVAQIFAALDAAAALHEALGDDPGGAAAASRLQAGARALERLAAPPTVDTAGALDGSCLDRVRTIDRAQAGELGLDSIGERSIPLVASGFPVLAALDAASRIPLKAPRQADGWRNTRLS